MVIDKNSWHFKLYLFSMWRAAPEDWRGDRADFEEIRKDVMKREKVDLCSYFNRAITMNLLYAAFLAFWAIVVLTAFVFAMSNFVFFLTGLLFFALMGGIFFGALFLIMYLNYLFKKKSNKDSGKETPPSIFVERAKAFKGKYCPIMEIK